MEQEKEAVVATIAERLMLNCTEYYEQFRQPLKISQLFRGQAQKMSRNGIEWSEVEMKMRELGAQMVLTPANGKYVYPKDTPGTFADLQDQVLDMYQLKNQA